MATTLVAENDLGMTHFLVQILGGSGYRILEAKDHSEALESVRSQPDSIDLLLAAINMPRSFDLAETVRREHPNLKVLFVSGDARPEFTLLRKLFTATDVLLEVERLLAIRGAGGH